MLDESSRSGPSESRHRRPADHHWLVTWFAGTVAGVLSTAILLAPTPVKLYRQGVAGPLFVGYLPVAGVYGRAIYEGWRIGEAAALLAAHGLVLVAAFRLVRRALTGAVAWTQAMKHVSGVMGDSGS